MSTGSLSYATAAHAVVLAARSGTISAGDLDTVLIAQTGKGASAIAGEATFGEEDRRLKDSLAAMKLQSSSLGGDTPGLAQLIQGYDAIQLAAAGKHQIKLRALALIGYKDAPSPAPLGDGPGSPRLPAPPAPPPRTGPSVAEIDEAIASLSAVPVTGFHGAQRCWHAAPGRDEHANGNGRGDGRRPTGSGPAHQRPAGHPGLGRSPPRPREVSRPPFRRPSAPWGWTFRPSRFPCWTPYTTTGPICSALLRSPACRGR